MPDVGGKLQITHEEPFKVELTRGQKGTYGWTITVHTKTGEQAVEQLRLLDAQLQEHFNGHLAPEIQP
jgi:predicted metal-dependent phosphotriesterase family hydrolase